MTLIAKIAADQLAARKAGDAIARGVLTPLLADASLVGKNNGNRESTDVEVIRVIKQHVGTTIENIENVKKQIPEGQNPGVAGGYHAQALEKLNRELAILESYLPKQLTDEELTVEIKKILANIPEGLLPIRAVMKGLSETHAGLYDAGKANKITMSLLQG